MSQMLAAQYSQAESVQFREMPIPEIGPDELLLRVEAASICGTDLKIVRHGHRKLEAGQSLILGHEFVGTIDRVGAAVNEWALGSRVGVAPNVGCGGCAMCVRGLPNMCPRFGAYGVTFDGGHAEYVRIRAASLHQGSVVRLSPQVDSVAASLTEPLSCALSGVRVADIGLGDVVLVYGAGPMGLLLMMLARRSGAARVIAVDLDESRLAWASRVGATDVIHSTTESVTDWVKSQTDDQGVNAVLIAVPCPELQQQALDILLPYGRLCLFAGWSRSASAVPLDTNPIHYKQLTVGGMTGGSPRDFREALKLIESGEVKVQDIISDVFHFADLAAAYERALSGAGMKIAIARERKHCRSGTAATAMAGSSDLPNRDIYPVAGLPVPPSESEEAAT